MVGVFINLFLFGLASVSLFTSIAFFVRERDAKFLRSYCLLLGIANFLINAGYSVMSFTDDISVAFIPRLVGLFGLNIFPLIELDFFEVQGAIKKRIRWIVTGSLLVYIIIDLMVFGRPSVMSYVRRDLCTTYEKAIPGPELFHYSYMIIIAIMLSCFGGRWYRSRKSKRDKKFSLEIVLANLFLVATALPDIFRSAFSTRYPYFAYCIGFSFLYFSFLIAIKNHIIFLPNVKNVCRELFYTIDVPVVILNLEGNVILCNNCAEKEFGIETGKSYVLRDLFALTDVGTMRILAKAEAGEETRCESQIKANGKKCSLHCSVNVDDRGEPFCIICTVKNMREESDERV